MARAIAPAIVIPEFPEIAPANTTPIAIPSGILCKVTAKTIIVVFCNFAFSPSGLLLFNDKHDILLEGLKRYANSIFYPSIDFINDIAINEQNLSDIIKKVISQFVKNHKLSQSAHEEITAMAHSDKDVAQFFHKNEIEMTNVIVELLKKNGFNYNDIVERAHIVIGLIDNICHEVVYHKHKDINYYSMTDIVVNEIVHILTKTD